MVTAKRTGAFLLLSILVSFSSLAETEQTNTKKPLSCYAKHLNTNETVKVKTISGFAGNKIATARWPLGYPTIVLDDSAFVKLPENIRQFVYYHECAHLQLLHNDERVMDCKSINSLIVNNNFSALDIRRLVQSLTQEFGWSRRWSDLLRCESFNKAD